MILYSISESLFTNAALTCSFPSINYTPSCTRGKEKLIELREARRYKWFLTPWRLTGGREVPDPNKRCHFNSNKPNADKTPISLMNM